MYGSDYEMWIATVGERYIYIKMQRVCLGLSVVVVVPENFTIDMTYCI